MVAPLQSLCAQSSAHSDTNLSDYNESIFQHICAETNPTASRVPKRQTQQLSITICDSITPHHH